MRWHYLNSTPIAFGDGTIETFGTTIPNLSNSLGTGYAVLINRITFRLWP
ncbi:MAG: hypothetical protein KGJ90_00050 [Patescibacteria group bacterium]|nr:hypothetical protein [Patescibacteria group bacterium]